MFFRITLIIIAGVVAACSTPKTSPAPKAGFSADWEEFERLAKRNSTRVSLPPFETTPEASLDPVNAANAAAVSTKPVSAFSGLRLCRSRTTSGSWPTPEWIAGSSGRRASRFARS